ncbi:hypothetical protein RO3G_15163 [Rhizopus delemar RA 99-880]|uniref:Uncharacterized protein n=1 Tax=Rhizopus delemar (strain RA 99-880 / ATCC MYA-4621 / FGSC 9543 / NRRL 43880) TaxID=246409 RepID=I1CPS2_RHIO9|nr:hypothetical protein RO3G_15163 [Rhizopus delemar RA 99-880]|eukprot:EIE90452.1 hypothetical protein RO3G_15163 [Rhizopus delemar RA 99-880]
MFHDGLKLPDEVLYRLKGIVILHIIRTDLAGRAKGRYDLDGDSRLRLTSIVGIFPNLIYLLANFISSNLNKLFNTLCFNRKIK